MNENQRGTVTVYGRDIRKPLLLDNSSEAQMILIKDAFGDPMMLLIRILSEDTWGLSTKGDEDWEEQLLKYGFARLADGAAVKDIVVNGIAPFLDQQKG